ncbi:MAG: helix-turn-helix domain-containing protein [Actinomycetota bacterium]
MPPITNPELGKAIREAREAKGISQRQLGKLSGVDYSSISRMERGEFASPDPVKLQKLARLLEVDVEEFYALAGYLMPEGLPELVPYMRAKYDMPGEAAEQLERYFARLQRRYGGQSRRTKRTGQGGRRGNPSR